jgi:hypothetical protein
MGTKILQSDSVMATPKAGEIGILFGLLEKNQQLIGERAAHDSDRARIVLGDITLNRMSGLRELFIEAPGKFSYGSAQEVLKNYSKDGEVKKTIHRFAPDNIKKYWRDNANGQTCSASDYEKKRSELNLVAKEYFETLEELRRLVRTDREYAEIIVRIPQWLTYCTADGDVIAHDVVRNEDKSFVRDFVNAELRKSGIESVVTRADPYGWTPLHWATMDYDTAQDILNLPQKLLESLTAIKDDAQRSVGDIIDDSIAREDRRLKELSTQDAIRAAMRSCGTTREMALSEELRGLKLVKGL